MNARTLLIGVGSPHGDDRAGWLAAQRAETLAGGRLQVRCVQTPAEMLDWLDQVDTLIVCDAVAVDWPCGAWRSWTWPSDEIVNAPFSGSHDLSLPATLALAAELGRLPPRVQVWGMAIERADALADPTPEIIAAAAAVAREICGLVCTNAA